LVDYLNEILALHGNEDSFTVRRAAEIFTRYSTAFFVCRLFSEQTLRCFHLLWCCHLAVVRYALCPLLGCFWSQSLSITEKTVTMAMKCVTHSHQSYC